MTAHCANKRSTRRAAPKESASRSRDTEGTPRIRPPERAANPAAGAKADRKSGPQAMSKTQTPKASSKKTRRRPWRHPTQRGIKVPYAAAAAISLMEMGITDYERIGLAVGLDAGEIERIDMAEDKAIRQLCLAGVPYGHYFTLESHIRCPKCSGMITLAPCVACDAPSASRPVVPSGTPQDSA